MIERWWPRFLALSLALGVLWALVPSGEETDAFPRKPVTLLVAYSPGGAVDTIARLVARYLEPELGQRVVVKNRPGAGGQIGYTSLAIAGNDGYHLGFVTAPSIQMLKQLRPTATFDLKDFVAIANIQADPVVLVVHADSPYNTLTDFLEAARMAPGELAVSGDGPLSNNQLQLAVAESTLDVEMNFVPFSGSGPALTALLGRQVQAAVPSSSAASSYLEGGKLRALAVFSDKALAALPLVPTISEATERAVPSVGMALRGVVAPAGVPDERLQLLADALDRAVHNPEFLAHAKMANLPLEYMGAEQFARYMDGLDGAVAEFLPLLTEQGD